MRWLTCGITDSNMSFSKSKTVRICAQHAIAAKVTELDMHIAIEQHIKRLMDHFLNPWSELKATKENRPNH